jgi:hypothetical protein
MNNQLSEIIGDPSVLKELKKLDGAQETAHFVQLMNHVLEIFKRKEPVRKETDKRLSMFATILDDLQEWENELDELVATGEITPADKEKAFLPESTWFAWKMNLNNIPAITKFLLNLPPHKNGKQRYIRLQEFWELQNCVER